MVLCSYSHHLSNLLDPYILSAPVHSLYIRIPVTYSKIVACRLLMYSLIVQSPVTSRSTSTKDHSRSLKFPLCNIIPEILLAIMCSNLSRAVIVASVTTQLSLLYRIPACNTALYIIYRALIDAPILPSTFATIPHILWTLLNLLYKATQSLSLYVTILLRYRNAVSPQGDLGWPLRHTVRLEALM